MSLAVVEPVDLSYWSEKYVRLRSKENAMLSKILCNLITF